MSLPLDQESRMAVDDHATAMKVAGFSISAIEEMRTRAEEENSENLDQRLRQFQVLDEVGSGSDDDSNGGRSGSGNDCQQLDDDEEIATDVELDEEDIENLLDQNLPDGLKEKKRPKYEESFKTVLEEKGHNHFELLPEGWVQVTHNSGWPLFLHKQTRVCCTSRPYFLGAGSVRKHAVPIAAIPCLNYKRALEEEPMETEIQNQKLVVLPDAENQVQQKRCEKLANGCPFSIQENQVVEHSSTIADQTNEVKRLDDTINTSNSLDDKITSSLSKDSPNDSAIEITTARKIVPAPKILTVTENIQNESLTPQQLNDYCKKLFKFKNLRVLRFRSWNARRKFTRNRKNIKNLQRPTLPAGTKLIKFPILASGGDASSNPRGHKEWIMNPNGKSFVCILHEYVQHALKKQPTYEFKELENAATPYSATVSINDFKYGTGYGTSKKQAKAEAARETLELLIPEMKDKITGVDQAKNSPKPSHKDLSVFDDIKIEDPRVTEFCNKTTEPPPHAILLTCLQRNFGLGDVHINYEITRTKNKKNEFTMTVGKHTAKVFCKNKREGKQLAAQAILQILHPHIKTWGSLLRLYGNNSIKTFKEKKLEEQEITILQSKAAVNQPNYAILDKLRSEMLKLAEKNKSVQTRGTFIPPNDVDLPTSSGSNLNNLEL